MPYPLRFRDGDVDLAVRLEEAGAGTGRAWLAMQAAHDLAAECAAGVPKVRRLDPTGGEQIGLAGQ